MKKEIRTLQSSEPQKRVKKYTIDEVLGSLYYECCDSDDDYDGSLHIVSDLNGKEVKILIKDIVHQAAQYQNK